MFKAILRGIADLLIYVVFMPIKILVLIFIGGLLLYAWIKYGKDTMIELYQYTKEGVINALKNELDWIKTGEV